VDGKSTDLRVSTFIINAFWRSLYAVNVFLFVALFLQFAIWGLSLCDFKFALPSWAETALCKEISRLGVETKISHIYVNMYGEISAESVRARFSGTPKDFLIAKKIYASVWFSKLLSGSNPIKTLRIIDAQLGSTLNGAEESPIIKNFSTDIHFEGQWLNVDSLILSLGDMHITASGYINENFDVNLLFNGAFNSKEKTTSKTKEKIDISKTWDSLFVEYPKIEEYISKFSEPMLNLSFSLCGNGEDNIVLTFESNGASIKVDEKLANIEKLRFRASHKNYGGVNNSNIELSADTFSFEGYPSLNGIAIHSDIAIEEDYYALENLDVSVNKIAYDGTEFEGLHINKDVLNKENLYGDWNVSVGSLPYKIAGNLWLSKDYDVKFSLDGLLDANLILSRKELADIPELKQLNFPTGICVNVEGEFFAKTSRTIANATIQTSNCTIMNIPVDSVRGKVDYTSDTNVMSATELHVETTEGWDIDGEFIQNFSNNQYIVRVLGDVRPMAIAHFMEPWWTRIMKDFKFNGEKNFPHADVYVEGTWGAPEYIWCFARASGGNAEYNGASFAKFGLNVLVNPNRISLYDISIESSAGGTATASLDWLYKNGITSFYAQNIFMDSTLSPLELIALGGDDAREVLDVVKFEKAPKLKFNAVLRNPANNPKKLSDIFNADVESDGGVSIEMVRVENISFKARSNKINTELENLKFDFCGGTADGVVDLKKIEKAMLFDANLRADKMNQLKFTQFLMSLGSPENKEKKVNDKKKSDEKSLIDGGENGVVSMSISLKGSTANFENSQGAGYAILENNDLMKLHLFGMLSRALSAMSLPFGSFNLTYAQSPFEIANGVVKFTKLDMGGPVMQIKGGANYDFVNDKLDSTLAVSPFGSLSMPIVSNVMSLINPLTSTVQVHLDGKLEDPEISVKVNPVNAIRSEEKIVEKIRDEL